MLWLLFLVLPTAASGLELPAEAAGAGMTAEALKTPSSCPRAAARGDLLRVHYVGRLGGAGGEVFDASRDRGHAYEFQLGAGKVREGIMMVSCLSFPIF